MRTEHVLVDRLWSLYAWPVWILPMRGVTLKTLQRYPSQPYYATDYNRTYPRNWHYGRIRFFVDELLDGRVLDPIEIDNVCDGGYVYPVVDLVDGHHRLAASRLTRTKTILAHYGGRVDLLNYLKGRSNICPR